MWRLIQDFFRQNWIMRGFIALGWLIMLIMLTSSYVSVEAIARVKCDELIKRDKDADESLSQLEDIWLSACTGD